MLSLGVATAAAVGLQRFGVAQADTTAGHAVPQAGGGRLLQSLHGTWDFLPAATGAACPPPATGWADIAGADYYVRAVVRRTANPGKK